MSTVVRKDGRGNPEEELDDQGQPHTPDRELDGDTLLTKEGDEMEKDIVCGMQVAPATAAGSSQYAGKTYYFCSTACKAKFDANPRQFVK